MRLKHLPILVILIVSVILASCGRSPSAPASTPASTVAPALPTPTPQPAGSPTWFRQGIVYQVFPRSFYDSNGDGAGDFKGIAAKLDHVQFLGANILELTAVVSSTTPGGMDVMDHSSLASGLGTENDLRDLIRAAHERKIFVIMSLPLAYMSNNSRLFTESYNKPDSTYKDWFQWTNTAHTAYKSFANARTLPLLNYTNVDVQAHLVSAAQHWLSLGVDGFFLPEAASIPHEFWKAWKAEVKKSAPNAVLVGEVWQADPAKLSPFVEDMDALLDVPVYTALAASPDRTGGGLLNGRGTAADFDAAITATLRYTPTVQMVRFAGSVSTNRVASLVGMDAPRQRLAAILVATLPGTPLIFEGDEIGMSGVLGAGATAEDFRRAPLDWFKAGKGQGAPTWFAAASQVNKPNDGISVEEELANPESLLNFYKKMLALRSGSAGGPLRGNTWQFVTGTAPTSLAYLRWDASGMYLVAMNLSSQTQSVTLDLTKTPRSVSAAGEDVLRGGVVTLPSNGRYTATLNAWEARVLRWK